MQSNALKKEVIVQQDAEVITAPDIRLAVVAQEGRVASPLPDTQDGADFEEFLVRYGISVAFA